MRQCEIPPSIISLEAEGGGFVSIQSPTHMSGPIVPQQSSGGVARLTVEGTVRAQNVQFELLESEASRTDIRPEPSMTCNDANPQRIGWGAPPPPPTPRASNRPAGVGWRGLSRRLAAVAVRLTRTQARQTYHLFICTEDQGWVD
eukprot:SAG11_NODE_2095_length_3833_cov_4.084092_3_plen_144_part_01